MITTEHLCNLILEKGGCIVELADEFPLRNDSGLDLLSRQRGFGHLQPQRKPIKPSVRFQIIKRDGYRCQMCGISAKDGATLEIDHITPVSKGGTNDPENLQVLCRDCNAGKSDHPL